jgi:hypothetical protein
MKRVLILFALFLYAGAKQVSAQEYQDLEVLWIDQKYEKLIEKAEHYTEKEKSKNDALPYLYMCKGLYRISLIEKYKTHETYRKAESDALSYAVKYKKKDKNGTYKADAEAFFAEMKKTYFEQTENYMMAKDYKKSLAIIKKVVQFDDKNPGAWLVKGVCEYEMKNKAEAILNTDLGVKLVKEISNFGEMYEVDQNFMRFALMTYAEYLMGPLKDMSKAKMVINLGYQYYNKVKDDAGDPIVENQKYVDLYNRLVNGK